MPRNSWRVGFRLLHTSRKVTPQETKIMYTRLKWMFLSRLLLLCFLMLKCHLASLRAIMLMLTSLIWSKNSARKRKNKKLWWKLKSTMQFTNGVLSILQHIKRELLMLLSSSGAESRQLFAFLVWCSPAMCSLERHASPIWVTDSPRWCLPERCIHWRHLLQSESQAHLRWCLPERLPIVVTDSPTQSDACQRGATMEGPLPNVSQDWPKVMLARCAVSKGTVPNLSHSLT